MSSTSTRGQPSIRSDASFGAIQTRSTTAVQVSVIQTDGDPFWRLEYAARGENMQHMALSLPHLGDFPAGTFDVATHHVTTPEGDEESASIIYEELGRVSPNGSHPIYEAKSGSITVALNGERIELQLRHVAVESANTPGDSQIMEGHISSDVTWACHAYVPAGGTDAQRRGIGIEQPQAAGALQMPAHFHDEERSTNFCRTHVPEG
jgi:hypothetical protein